MENADNKISGLDGLLHKYESWLKYSNKYQSYDILAQIVADLNWLKEDLMPKVLTDKEKLIKRIKEYREKYFGCSIKLDELLKFVDIMFEKYDIRVTDTPRFPVVEVVDFEIKNTVKDYIVIHPFILSSGNIYHEQMTYDYEALRNEFLNQYVDKTLEFLNTLKGPIYIYDVEILDFEDTDDGWKEIKHMIQIKYYK
jgi:hypothetical protein